MMRKRVNAVLADVMAVLCCVGGAGQRAGWQNILPTHPVPPPRQPRGSVGRSQGQWTASGGRTWSDASCGAQQ